MKKIDLKTLFDNSGKKRQLLSGCELNTADFIVFHFILKVQIFSLFKNSTFIFFIERSNVLNQKLSMVKNGKQTPMLDKFQF